MSMFKGYHLFFVFFLLGGISDLVDAQVADRCTVGGIVWRNSLSSVRLSSAHVLLPSHGLYAADKNSLSAKPFTIVVFVCQGKRQTCNIQRATGGAFAMCSAIWTQEHRRPYAMCASQHTYLIRSMQN